jgi:hypothetical protein
MAWVGVFSFAKCFLIWTLSESPRRLIEERQRDKAAKALRYLRRSNVIDAELDKLERQEATMAPQDITMFTFFTSVGFRWLLFTRVGGWVRVRVI